jgi:exopolysaccharide biosynthesis polyprenyl glycosylphosphotransferase
MLREYSRSLSTLLRLSDLVTLGAAWPIAHLAMRALGWAPHGSAFPEPPLLGTAIVLFAWIGTSSVMGLYGSQRREGLRHELSGLFKAVAAVALIALAVAVASRSAGAPVLDRGLVGLATAFLLLASSRVALRLAANFVRRRNYNLRYFAVVGSGDEAEAVVAQVAEHAHWGYAFLGYVREPGAPAETGDAPVLGSLDDLQRLLGDHVIDEVIFAARRGRLDWIEGAVQLCREQGVLVRIVLDDFAGASSRLMVTETGAHAMLTISSTPTGSLGLAAKRAFDLLASATALVLLSPVLIAIAIAIRRDSAGPVFFKQRRVGLSGREFDFFKFRSMRVGAEAELALLRASNEMDGPVFKMRLDPRITRVGRFLRKTSLDELPQFWNVLRGQMSLVGPRPPLPAEVRQYKPWQRRRLSVKPGITCTWQVSGRNEIDFEQWMRLDLAYIDGWTFWGDITICLKTVPAVLFARGAR